MSYENLLSGLYVNNLANPTTNTNNELPNALKFIEPTINSEPIKPAEPTLFSVDQFKQLLKEKVSAKNKDYAEYSTTINSYDMFSCSRIPFFRIKNYPVHDYSGSYLPVELRCVLGSSCHEFIQGVGGIFTETEVCLKVPDLKISARLDGLINHNVLVEIKSCGYSDYEKILKSNTPRIKDFWQTNFYKYLLENYLDIMKLQPPSRSGSVPKQKQYDIQYIQFIYVCHELIAAEHNSIGESVEAAKVLKRQLESKRNPFWFIKVLTVDLSTMNVEPYTNYIREKHAHILNSIETNTIPPLDSKYIQVSDCYFCLFNKICKNH